MPTEPTPTCATLLRETEREISRLVVAIHRSDISRMEIADRLAEMGKNLRGWNETPKPPRAATVWIVGQWKGSVPWEVQGVFETEAEALAAIWNRATWFLGSVELGVCYPSATMYMTGSEAKAAGWRFPVEGP